MICRIYNICLLYIFCLSEITFSVRLINSQYVRKVTWDFNIKLNMTSIISVCIFFLKDKSELLGSDLVSYLVQILIKDQALVGWVLGVIRPFIAIILPIGITLSANQVFRDKTVWTFVRYTQYITHTPLLRSTILKIVWGP